MSDNLSKYLTVTGYPMTDESTIIAALVIRLGGEVLLNQTEYDAAHGLMITKHDGGILLEANTEANLGHTPLDDEIID